MTHPCGTGRGLYLNVGSSCIISDMAFEKLIMVVYKSKKVHKANLFHILSHMYACVQVHAHHAYHVYLHAHACACIHGHMHTHMYTCTCMHKKKERERLIKVKLLC